MPIPWSVYTSELPNLNIWYSKTQLSYWMKCCNHFKKRSKLNNWSMKSSSWIGKDNL